MNLIPLSWDIYRILSTEVKKHYAGRKRSILNRFNEISLVFSLTKSDQFLIFEL